MSRVKRGIVSRRKHKKVLKSAKGYVGVRSKHVKRAKEANLHAGVYAYQGRKLKKRDFRSLWITRISEAAKKEGLSYSVLINNMKKKNIELDRKILADLVVNDPETFTKIVKEVK